MALLLHGESVIARGLDGRAADLRALPVPAEINTRLAHAGEERDHAELVAIGVAAMIFAPCCLLCVAREVRSSDVMVMSDFSATHAAKEFLRAVRAGPVSAIGLLMVDTAHFVPRL